jgi:type VI secretion system Hcp family effector
MALNVYLEGEAEGIGAFDGDSSMSEIGGVDVSSNHVEVYEFNAGSRVGTEGQAHRASSHRRILPVRFEKRTDQTTPLFYQALKENKAFTGTFKFFDNDQTGETRHRFSVTVTNARILSVETKSPDAFDADESNRPIYDVIEIVPHTIAYEDLIESKMFEDRWDQAV